mgnify:CR=1 FL=1
MQKIPSSGVLLYVVALNFYGGKAFFGKFMVVRVRLWSNTNPERGEAPIGQIPVWADGVQYVWGQYAMHNLGANSARPPVDKFTNFMVGRNPLVIERLLPHSKSEVASSQGASFFSPKILLSFVLDFTVILRHARNK